MILQKPLYRVNVAYRLLTARGFLIVFPYRLYYRLKIKTFNSSMLDLYLRNLPLTLLCLAKLANLIQTRGLS